MDRFLDAREKPGSLVAIGNFDGVHRGHRAVLAEAADIARARGLEPIVLTFDPHPAEVLGRKAPPLLTSLERKKQLCQRAMSGGRVVVVSFDRTFAAQTPREFAERVIVPLGTRVVMVGKNFRFGANRAGDFDELSRLGNELGFETRSHALVGDDAGSWSSSRVRNEIAQGHLEEACRILGRWHSLSGTVVHGDKRGRTIGFPTANIVDIREALPPFGVMAVVVDVASPPGPLSTSGEGENASPPGPLSTDVERGNAWRMLGRGVANLGLRPTVDSSATQPRLEVHLFDFEGNLYGRRLRVHLVQHLRPEKRFTGIDMLRAQIIEDSKRARAVLADVRPDPNARGAWA
ncbi:MAG: bifunctional riboflavin kinase/FMN adenylyltransferase [Polyangiaceae bacterium]|nr:bifunctional riboflavin kinase/FMN adenylyltransferase [Polyangiaceae bacterium]